MVNSTDLQRLSLDLRKVRDDNSLAVPRLGLGILKLPGFGFSLQSEN